MTRLTPEQVQEIRELLADQPEADQPEAERVRKACILLREAAGDAMRYLDAGPVVAASFELFFTLWFEHVGPDTMREKLLEAERIVARFVDDRVNTLN